MTAKEAVRIYAVLATEDAKALECERASVRLCLDTNRADLDDLDWTASIAGWNGCSSPVGTWPQSGRTPIEALAKAHGAFCKAVAKKLAEQAEEVGA